MEKKFRRIEFILDNFTDKELIAWLDKQPNRSMYIRELVLEDLQRKTRNKKRGA